MYNDITIKSIHLENDCDWDENIGEHFDQFYFIDHHNRVQLLFPLFKKKLDRDKFVK